MDKPLARLIKKKKDSKSKMKDETLWLIPQKYKGSEETLMNNLCANKSDNLEEMDKFLKIKCMII